MQSNQANQSQDGRLRVAYANTVMTYGVPANLTLGDVARMLGKNAKRRYGPPLAIDVILASRNADPAIRI